jgi:hypothetical protein
VILTNRLGSWGAAAALAAAGCTLEDVDSDAIRTEGMFADMLALAPGDGTTWVRVQLTVGGASGTNVTLVNDDRLEATYREVTAVLERTGRGRYQAQLDGDEADEVSIWFSRGADDTPAGGSAELPEPFLTTLVTDASDGIARGSDVVVSWTPSMPGADLGWEVEGRCLWTRSGTTADDGSLTLGPESFEVRATRIGEECDVAITLDRTRERPVDPAWIPGSTFRAVQRRAVSFISTPAPSELGEPAGALDID